MSSPVNTKWFQQRVADRRLSQRDVARRLGRHPSAVSLLFKGRRRMQMSEAVVLADLLGVPLDQVLHAAGLELPPEPTTAIPVIGWVDADGAIRSVGKGWEGPKKVERPGGMPDGTVAVRLQDATHRQGWVVYFVPSDLVDPEAVGRWSVIETHEGRRFLGVVNRSLESGRWSITSLCGEKKTDRLRLNWACPVVWVKV